MKDKVYLTLALIGFVILAIFVVKNYDIKQDDKVFGVDTYYIPQEVKSKTDSSIDLAQQMSGARRLTCPQTDIVKTSDHVFNIHLQVITIQMHLVQRLCSLHCLVLV